MTVSEAPTVAPAGALLPVPPTPEKGGEDRFAALLGKVDLPQGFGLHEAVKSDEQSSEPTQRKHRGRREVDPSPSEIPSSNTAPVNFNEPVLPVAMTRFAGLTLDASKLVGMAPANTPEASQPDVALTIRPGGTRAQATSEPPLQVPSIAAAGGVSAEETADEGLQAPLSTVRLDGGSGPKLISKDIPLIGSTEGSARGDVRPESEPAQENRGALNASTTLAGTTASEVSLSKASAAISGNSPQLHAIEALRQSQGVSMARQPSPTHVEPRSLSGIDKATTVASNAKDPIPLSTSAAPDQVHGEEGGPPAVEAMGDSPESSGGSGHRDLPHAPEASSAPERLSSREETAPHPTAPFTDLMQMGAGRSIFAQTARSGAEGDAALSGAASSTQAAFQRVADFNAGRELQNALRGDLRVGVPTEVFGHVTIQTTATAGQVSAQVSLEDVRQSAVLAGHLPVVEQRLTQHLGVDASVRLAAGSNAAGAAWGGAGGGGPGGNASQQQGRRSPASDRPAMAVPSLSSPSGHREENPSSTIYGNQMPSVRLDLRV